jgi:tRNA pseudouridine55 synthase
MRLGISTDTHDLTGEVVVRSDGWEVLELDQIEQAAESLVGLQQQRPPKYSAKKVGGQRAYRIARRGDEVEIPPREVEIFEFSVNSVDGPELSFECEVSSGTYIRAIARDLGSALGCGAHLSSLRRTSVGHFSINRAQSLTDIVEGDASIGEMAEAVEHLTNVPLEDPEARKKISHGQPIPAEGCDESIVALVEGHKLIGIAERRDDMFKPKVVLEG